MPKLIQVSKENVNGKWVKLAFYEKRNGDIVARQIREKSKCCDAPIREYVGGLKCSKCLNRA